MLETTKEIVIALINAGQIGHHGDTNANLNDVKDAIKEIYQALEEAKNAKFTAK